MDINKLENQTVMTEQEFSEQEAIRREKLNQLISAGKSPYDLTNHRDYYHAAFFKAITPSIRSNSPY